ncbi:putative Ig domain-containing protein [Chondrinema litorale]|uniref:putative Ig domain-containing protein n=1 Tax=Chondrinema litorale TaxID=2994555 RepID=UPI002542BBD9|nr:putative Ig domain-containing protein [Chondrinema litorale]UZR96957.1 putative Ig domain-containing protein [Chondrinema litorale]
MGKHFTSNYLLFVAFFFISSSKIYSQIRPDVDIGSSDEFSSTGICTFCSTADHENAYDNSESTFADMSLGVNIAASLTAHYEFQENIPTGNDISLILALDGTGSILSVVDGIITTDVLSDINIILKDSADNVIETYNSISLINLELLDNSTNKFLVSFQAPSEKTGSYGKPRKIDIKYASLLGVSSGVQIYDITTESVNRSYADINYSSGVSDPLVCIGCSVSDTDGAVVNDTTGRDPNTDFSTLKKILGVGGYVYQRVDWSTPFSSNRDIYLTLEDASGLLNLNLLGDALEFEILYTDGSIETVSNSLGNSDIIDVTLLYDNANKYLVKLTPKDYFNTVSGVKVVAGNSILGLLIANLDLNFYNAYHTEDTVSYPALAANKPKESVNPEFTKNALACVNCAGYNHNYAFDNNINTYAQIRSDIAIADQITAYYEFTTDLTPGENLDFTFSFDNALPLLGVVDGVITSDLLANLSIEFLDASDNTIETYSSTNNVELILLDESDNLFQVRLIVPEERTDTPDAHGNVRKVNINFGGLLGLDNTLNIHDIENTSDVKVFADVNESSGVNSAILCLNCEVVDSDKAVVNTTTGYDPNTDYSLIKKTLSLGGEVMQRVDWSTPFSADRPIYLTLEDVTGLLDISLFSDEITFKIYYDDGSAELISDAEGNGNLIEASLLFDHSDIIKVEVTPGDPSKNIEGIEVIVNDGILGLIALELELRFYNAYYTNDISTLPIAIDDEFEFYEDVTAAENVANNDIRPNDEDIVLVQDVQNGFLTLNADGSFVYNADTLFVGIDSFVYKICDDLAITTCSEATVYITILDDIEAVYTEYDSLPFDEYVNGDTLATVIDGNGDILSATVTDGSLPPGTDLASDGTITVSDSTQLVEDSYTFTVQTVDELGNTTENEITIEFEESDEEAVYVVNDPLPFDEYGNGDTLATVTDGNGEIVDAEVTDGSLPPGTDLATDGTITVSDSTQLVEGSYTFTVTTTDEDGNTTETEITIEFEESDEEAVYVVNDPLPFDEYGNGDTLATVTDGNGEIVDAEVTDGSLPPGTDLVSDGTITVSDSTQLVEGSYTFTVTTTDENGNTTETEITIEFEESDEEAVYVVNDPLPFDEYGNGDTLATVTDGNGEIVDAEVTEGSLPPGTDLASDGTITVSDSSQLVEGSYTFTVTTTDEDGNTTETEITIEFEESDEEAVYVVNDPLPFDEYDHGDTLATVTDGNGEIVDAEVTEGSLPPGTDLATDGTITISDSTQLVEDSYTFTVTTTDEDGNTTETEITIEFEESDEEAVYVVNDPLPFDEYDHGDTLATVTDDNGEIVDAEVTDGSLPPGTDLATDGTITVSDSTQLVEGSYTFTVTTTDENGNTTETEITIEFKESDEEAVYVVNDPLPFDEYVNGDTLATVIDGNGDVLSATVTDGSLPPGTDLASDGTITVSDSTQLVEGRYTFTVQTVDELGNTTENEITIEFEESDKEAVYVVNDPLPFDEYVNGDTLATVIDGNGDVLSATVTDGSLPPGTDLASDGTITVSDSTQLVEGRYTFTVQTVDELGNTTENEITIEFEESDEEAVYVVNDPLPFDEYGNGDTLAYVTDDNGEIVDAEVTEGSLPPGTDLASDGTITVSDSTQLVEGSYTFTVTTTDENGNTTETEITIEFEESDIEAVYVVDESQPFDSYLNSDLLAIVTDGNGDITSAVVIVGNLPDGTSISSDGTISVSDASQLSIGSFTFTVQTTDEFGNTTDSELTITFEPSDIEAIYTINEALPFDEYSNGDTLATVVDGNGAILSAIVTDGSLPPGTDLATDGTITVSDSTQLVEGSYTFTVQTVDELGNTTETEITIEFEESDEEAVYVVNAPLPFDEYGNGDTLATVTDGNGEIVDAEVTEGSLPPGTDLATDGPITVSDSTQLVEGSYTFTVTTTDENGNTTETEITIEFEESDIEAVYVVDESQPFDSYLNSDLLAIVTDGNGDITSAVVIVGNLPDGTSISSDGTISVSDASQLSIGSFTFTVQTTDEFGNTTDSELTITFEPSDIEAIYTINEALPFDEYSNGDTLATVVDGNGAILSAIVTDGSLPPGTDLASDGTITVSDSTQLVEGSYTFTVQTVDELGNTTETEITIIIEPSDIEAIYFLTSSLSFDAYNNGDSLAWATDGNGDIVDAILVNGTLPNGTSLDTIGKVYVTDASQLTPGDYTITVKTTDVLGNTTTTDLTLTIEAADQEATYLVAEPMPFDEYENGAKLAIASDPDGDIVNAVVSASTLPDGTTLSSDGTISVSDSTQLLPGLYTISITTTDELGNTTTTELEITLEPSDIEAVYVVDEAIPFDEYNNGDVLAIATDGNGDIINAVVIIGSLPLGTSIASDGTISVSDANQITIGSFTFTVQTTDELGNTTDNVLTITFEPSDIEAIYNLNDPLPFDEYSNGDTLATVTDGNGDIISATVTVGSLPIGTNLESDGTITVSDTALIEAGSFTLTIQTIDELGNSTDSEITIVIDPSDSEAVFTINDALPFDEYASGDTLATVIDADGEIVNAEVLDGTLPAGTSLLPDGTIVVSDPSKLVEGTYTFTVETTDEKGNTSETELTIEIEPSDIEAIYAVRDAAPFNEYLNGDTLATVTDGNGDIIAAIVTIGSLPNGASIATDGIITVTDASSLSLGSYTITIITTDILGNTTESEITIEFNNGDQEAEYSIAEPIPYDEIGSGDLLAFATDADGDIVNASIVSGELPAGTSLENDGSIKASDTDLLIEGTYNLTIKTTDVLGNTTDSEITLVLEPSDEEAVYVLDEPLPYNEYNNGHVLAIATDGNGAIISATVTDGSLPLGTEILSDGTIQVSSAIFLEPGSYTITVRTIDELGNFTDNELTLVIEPADIEAVYTIRQSLPYNEYNIADVLADATDENGAIISATIKAGTLPPGTELKSDGTIEVNDASKLEEGIYALVVITIDELGNSTETYLVLELEPVNDGVSFDNEAIYVVSEPMQKSTYGNTQFVAVVTDKDGGVVKALVIAGELPAGFALIDSTGFIVVVDQDLIVPGSTTFTVKTTDAEGNTTNSQLTLTVLADDIEAIYTVEFAAAIDSYQVNQVLASVTDSDGPIISASVIAGTLPPGSSINPVTGEITVTNPSELIAGNYPLSIITTDVNGNTTISVISIILLPEGSETATDRDAVYYVNDTPVNGIYYDGQTLAYVLDPDGPVIKARLVDGDLPPGTILNPVTGEISIVNERVVVPGAYQFTIRTEDELGGVTDNLVTIIIVPGDLEAVYFVDVPYPVNYYRLDQFIAQVSDPNGPIVKAESLNNNIPDGVYFNPVNGTFSISDTSLLEARNYPQYILTTDIYGHTTYHAFIISFKPVDGDGNGNTVLIANDDEFFVIEDSVVFGNVFINDIGNSFDNISITVSPINGAASIDADGTFTYRPTLNYFGIDSFTYRICLDGEVQTCDEAVVVINVTENNLFPDLELDISETQAGEPILLDVLANDSEPDGDSLYITEVFPILQANGDMEIVDNKLIYTPNEGYVGLERYRYQACDTRKNACCSEEIIEINVVAKIDFYISDGFTPDGDGINEHWNIPGIEDFDENKVKIFNRWGRVVFETERYNNTDNFWDGKPNKGNVQDQKVPAGTYFYVLYTEPGSKPKNGFIVVNY